MCDGKGGEAEGSKSFSLKAINDAPTTEPLNIKLEAEHPLWAIVTEEELLQGSKDVDGDQLSIKNIKLHNGKIEELGDGKWRIRTNGNDATHQIEFSVRMGL